MASISKRTLLATWAPVWGFSTRVTSSSNLAPSAMSVPLSANKETEPCELTWLNEGAGKVVEWARGGVAQKDVRPAVPVLKSVGGGAGLFAMPPHVDQEHSSPIVQVLSTDPQGTNSRRKVSVVLLEV